jgi:hypothetical protein
MRIPAVFFVPMAIMITTTLTRILKVNRTSSSTGRQRNDQHGHNQQHKERDTEPESSNPDKRCRIVDMDSVVIFKFF